MAFYVGQKVVCVDASPCRHRLRHSLTHGAIYVIAGFDTEDPSITNLHLEGDEVVFQPGWDAPVGWSPDRFRPVVERKTDISIFKAMLNPAKKAAETVGVLAFGWGIMVVIQFAQFAGGQ